MYDDFLLSNKYFRSFCIYRLIFGISYSLMIPILPLFFKHNGMSTVTIGIVISLYGVSKTIIQIPFGVISNNIGDKLTLKLSLLLMTFIPIGYILANTCFNYGTYHISYFRHCILVFLNQFSSFPHAYFFYIHYRIQKIAKPINGRYVRLSLGPDRTACHRR